MTRDIPVMPLHPPHTPTGDGFTLWTQSYYCTETVHHLLFIFVEVRWPVLPSGQQAGTFAISIHVLLEGREFCW